MKVSLSTVFKSWDNPFKDGVGLIASCEEDFLPVLDHIIRSLYKKRVGIKVVKGLDRLSIAAENDTVVRIIKGHSFDITSLEDIGLKRVSRVWEVGEYSVMGDVVIFWPSGYQNPIRLSLFDSTVESISYIDANNRVKIEEIDSIAISNDSDVLYSVGEVSRENSDIYLYYVKGKSRGSISLQLDKSGVYPYTYNIGVKSIPNFGSTNSSMAWRKILGLYKSQGFTLVYYGDGANLDDSGLEGLFDYKVEGNYEIRKGFVFLGLKLLFVTNYDLIGEVNLVDGRGGKVNIGEEIFKRFAIGDYVVHEDHGIGIFKGIVENDKGRYLEIAYDGKDRLLVPGMSSSKVSKFVGSGVKVPRLTGLNSGVWKRIKKGVQEDILAIAKELVQLQAIRKLTQINPIVDDYLKEKEYWDFIERFEFEDTEDQFVISNQILEDFKQKSPMDRLIVGDVGFGKTEVALRAAFAVVNAGYQVAILAPTTILVHQHFVNIQERFKSFPFKVGSLSRVVSGDGRESIIDGLKDGKIDIVVGTHSLLSDQIQFKNLGLIVIDEEQRFGVKQKEVLKEKRASTHVLSLSATPIPRTLSLAINGVRDMSILASVPHNRKAIKNWFGEFDWEKVVSAIKLEIDRKGQVYYLHNRIADLGDIKEKLESLIPDIKIATVYGQMYGKTLSRYMQDFIDRKYDILLSTTIIENGLDLPNVNTLIVDDSDRYGLSQLYQIRGRVGRGDKQAYAYFMYPSLRGNSELRLDALSESEALGSGFLLSNRDLEIRGAGNILGREQSGAINSVGYGLYTKMLSDTVKELKRGRGGV